MERNIVLSLLPLLPHLSNLLRNSATTQIQILLSQMEVTQFKRLINHLKGVQFKQSEGPVQPEREGLPETEVPNFIYTYLAAVMMQDKKLLHRNHLFISI